ncbi:MAG: YdcF family protein [bacterium]
MIALLGTCLLLSVSSCSAGGSSNVQVRLDAVIVVLGNEPLDDNTPTVDMVARVNRAVTVQREQPGALLLFTGGPTSGTITEARMMADLAITMGVSTNSILLEERARSTRENALLTAGVIRDLAPRRLYIVSRKDHLDWAMPIFRRIDVFATAEPLSCEVSLADIIAQMEAYLRTHESARVRERLLKLKNSAGQQVPLSAATRATIFLCSRMNVPISWTSIAAHARNRHESCLPDITQQPVRRRALPSGRGVATASHRALRCRCLTAS